MSEYKRLTKVAKNNNGISFTNECYRNGRVDDQLIKRTLFELENALENGTLVRLPAPLGSDLWTIEYPTYKRGKETVMSLSVKNANVEKHKYPLSFSNVDMVGKYYFLTREEAEAKLRELKGE